MFLASSNDMMKYREAAQQIVDDINEILGKHMEFSIQLFRKKKKVTPSMGRPQQIIFDQSNFEDFDVFIWILGNRLGTPTGAFDKNNMEYEAGALEEFYCAYDNYINVGKPSIMIFKDDSPIQLKNVDFDQYNKVQEFISKFQAKEENPGIYMNFQKLSQFKKIFKNSLISQVFQIIKYKTNNELIEQAPKLSEIYTTLGYSKMFVPETNEQRMSEKKEAIENSNIVYLIAKSGNSFLGSLGNRYLDLLKANVENGKEVKILLINPWSIDAVMTAFSEEENQTLIKYLNGEYNVNQIMDLYLGTQWYKSKLYDVMQEYEHLYINYPQIQLNFIDSTISASVLITDKWLFYEPYSNYCNIRKNKKMATFEVKIANTHNLYKESLQHFNALWANSSPYYNLMKNQQKYKKRLYNSLASRIENETKFYIGVHALIHNEDKILLIHRLETKSYMPNLWDIPGGSKEIGERPEATVIREILEETNLKVRLNNLQFAYSNFTELPERQTIQLIYDADYISGEIKLNSKEHDKYLWVTLEDAKKMRLINFLDEYLNKIK